MIHEYALDPEVIADWNSFRFFVDQFGVSNGRLISRFPKRWKKFVYDAITRNKTAEIERLRIVERLSNMDHLLLKQSREYDYDLSWIDNALLRHPADPFRAIISGTELKNEEIVILADTLDITHPLWSVETQKPIPRTAEELASVAKPLLVISSEIIFVDPHFDPHEYRFRRPLEHFVQVALNVKNQVRRIELHFKDGFNKPLFDEHFKEACRKKISPIIPAGCELKLIRWKERTGGKDFHARYILTDKGGLLVERGLDEGEEGQTTPVLLLNSSLHAEYWNDFQKFTDLSQCTYEFDNEITVPGEKQ